MRVGLGSYQQDWAYGAALKATSPGVDVLRASVRGRMAALLRWRR